MKIEMKSDFKKAFIQTHFFVWPVWFILFSMIQQGCLPQDIAQPINPSSLITGPQINFAGFNGVTSAQTLGANKVKLTWDISSDPQVFAYNIYDASLFFAPKLIKSVTAPIDSVTLTGLVSQNFYSFRVRAATANNKEDTNLVDLPAIPYGGAISATILSSSSASITFNDVSNTDQALIYCRPSSSSDFSLMRIINDVTQTQANVTGLTSGTTYACKVNVAVGKVLDNNDIEISFTPIGAATHLVFSTQPSGGAVGAAFSTQPVVTILDANNNVVSAGPDAAAPISLTLSQNSPTQGTPRGLGSTGTVTLNAVKGVASFTTINMQEVGMKILTATKPDSSAQSYGSATMSVNSTPFSITPGSISATASTIVATVVDASGNSAPASSLPADGSASYTITIKLADDFGNAISGIKPAFASSNPADTLVQPALNTDTTGIAVGSISSTSAGISTLRVSSPAGLTNVTTHVTFAAGTPTKVVFQTQPTTSASGANNLSIMRVAIQDTQGNVVTSSTANVTLSISANPGGGTLSGTATVAAVNGVATFTGLGIDRIGNGYKVTANSAGLVYASSNSFNVTSGFPQKIAIIAPTHFTSTLGTTQIPCSSGTAIRFQLQDNGGNAANALSPGVTVNLTGLGSAQLFAGSSCSGNPVGSPSSTANPTLTFTTGSSFKDYFIKDTKAETLTLNATDTASVLRPITQNVTIEANQIGITIPSYIASGACTPFSIGTAGADRTPGPVASPIPVQITGLGGSDAAVYSNSTCTTALDYTNILYPSLTNSLSLYFKAPTAPASNFSMNVADLGSLLQALNAPQSVTIGPASFVITGNATMVSGVPTRYIATLKDANGNSVNASKDIALSVAITGGPNAYMSASGASAVHKTSFTIPTGSSNISMYLNDISAEALSFTVSDSSSSNIVSSTMSVNVLPSALSITSSSISGQTNQCAGPFTVQTIDGNSQVNPVYSQLPINLSGTVNTGTFTGSFYSDSLCSTSITQLVFQSGQSSQNFYFQTLAVNNYTLNASDPASLLTPGSLTVNIKGAPGWIGTGKSAISWFQKNILGMNPQNDGLSYPQGVHVDASQQFMYVADTSAHRVLKYDLVNNQYIGWIGRVSTAPTGSKISDNASACVQAQNGAQTPGWCTGGSSSSTNGNGYTALGQLYNPVDIADNGPTTAADTIPYIYVTSGWHQGNAGNGVTGGGTINRYRADTGAFAGWIGQMRTDNVIQTATNAVGNPGSTCRNTANYYPTPGWCMGGSSHDGNGTAYGWINQYPYSQLPGDGRIPTPRAVKFYRDSAGQGWLLVAGSVNISRFNATTGAFAGWIGMLGTYNTKINGVVGFTEPDTTHTPPPIPNIAPLSSVSVTYNGQTSITCPIPTGPSPLPVPTASLLSGGAVPAYTSTSTDTTIGSNTVPALGWCMGGSADHVNANNAQNAAGGFHYETPINLYIDPYTDPSGQRVFYVMYSNNWGANPGSNTEYYYSSQIHKYNLKTGVWLGKMTPNTPLSNALGITGDGTPTSPARNLYTMENGYPTGSIYTSRLIRIDVSATDPSFNSITGWVSKVNPGSTSLITPSSPTKAWVTSAGGCESINATTGNVFTPGWCISGTAKSSSEEQGFSYTNNNNAPNMGMPEYSGDGTAQNSFIYIGAANNTSSISIRKWDAYKGTFVGSLSFLNTNTKWSGDTTLAAGETSNDDNSFYTPSGIAYDKNGGYLYVANYSSNNIKKIDPLTGTVVGTLGGVSTTPTSSFTIAINCLAAILSPSPTPGWCLGALWNNSVSEWTDGIPYHPWGLAVDSLVGSTDAYLYVLLREQHRIQRYNKSTGVYGGWIGYVSGATTNTPSSPSVVNQFTSGWSFGGTSAAIDAYYATSSNMAGLWSPGGILVYGGVLYVTDSVNNRVNSYSTLSGQFNGWIGSFNPSTSGSITQCNPSGGAFPKQGSATGYSGQGWCKGGANNYFPGGWDDPNGFFGSDGNDRNNISTDGQYLYIMSGYGSRVDKWDIQGIYTSTLKTRPDVSNPGWTDPVTYMTSNGQRGNLPWGWEGIYPRVLYVDLPSGSPTAINPQGAIYYTTDWYGDNYIVKRNLNTGALIGWRGYASSGITGGDPGCAGATGVLPGWCTPFTGSNTSTTLGGFNTIYGITGDDNFIYITDGSYHRVTRVPK